jgi:hypothetical protein
MECVQHDCATRGIVCPTHLQAVFCSPLERISKRLFHEGTAQGSVPGKRFGGCQCLPLLANVEELRTPNIRAFFSNTSPTSASPVAPQCGPLARGSSECPQALLLAANGRAEARPLRRAEAAPLPRTIYETCPSSPLWDGAFSPGWQHWRRSVLRSRRPLHL